MARMTETEKLLAQERKRRLEAQGITTETMRRKAEAPIPEPTRIEAEYNAALQKVQRVIQEETNAALQNIGAVGAGAAAGSEKVRSFVRNVMEQIVPTIVRDHGRKTQDFNFRKYDNKLYNAFGFNSGVAADVIQAMLDSWTRENVELISNTNAKQLTQIETALLRATRSGTRATDLAKEINKIYKGTRSNVKLIARDQISKYNGQIDRAKQLGTGVSKYRWRTSRDERVRAVDRGLEGKIFAWEGAPKPPGGQHPGQKIQCRCSAEPVLESAVGP